MFKRGLKHVFVILSAIVLLEIVRDHFVFEIPVKDNYKAEAVVEISGPKFWLFTAYPTDYAFGTIESVLTQMGLQRIIVNASSAETIHYDWDLLWTFEDMMRVPLNFSNLQHYQKINHIPGIAYVASKSLLTTTTDSKYVPKGFTDIKALKKFAVENPETRFVQKFKASRGVSLKTVSEMNFTTTGNQNTEYFAQVFVEDPLLMAGHKFDFSTYIAITSVDPLRVYYYSKTFHMRFCELPYDPNNFDVIESYAVTDNHIPGLEFPEIQKYFNNSYVAKDALNAFLKELGHDPRELVEQVEDCIQSIVMSKEPMFIRQIEGLKAKYGQLHFFELLRFDFVADAKLNVYLMEVNMSPNMVVYPKIIKSRHMLENVLYNFFNLVGVGSYMTKQHIRYFDTVQREAICHVNSLTVLPETCMNSPCVESCDAPECELCWNCLTHNFKWDLMMAYLEHMNKGDMKRVVPPSNVKIFYK